MLWSGIYGCKNMESVCKSVWWLVHVACYGISMAYHGIPGLRRVRSRLKTHCGAECWEQWKWMKTSLGWQLFWRMITVLVLGRQWRVRDTKNHHSLLSVWWFEKMKTVWTICATCADSRTTETERCSRKRLNHARYSPNSSPSDYFAFPKLKMELKGDRYATISNIPTSVTTKLKTIPITDLLCAMHRVVHRLVCSLQQCVQNLKYFISLAINISLSNCGHYCLTTLV